MTRLIKVNEGYRIVVTTTTNRSHKKTFSKFVRSKA